MLGDGEGLRATSGHARRYIKLGPRVKIELPNFKNLVHGYVSRRDDQFLATYHTRVGC